MTGITRNRALYAVIFIFILALTWLYGGAMLYVSLYALALTPLISCGLTFALLRGLRVTQRAKTRVAIKDEPCEYEIIIRNPTPMFYHNIECLFVDDHFAVETERGFGSLSARPFMNESHTVRFRVRYRGEYEMGLRALRVADLTGLFRLERRLPDTFKLKVLPRVAEARYFPLTQNLYSQAQSNFEIKEEDYAVISDIRKYEPSDPIKRIHWKLTAKRGEWLVKTYQSNAFNRITFIIDTSKRPYAYEECLALEDRMVETALATARYCLKRSMPVELIAGTGVKQEGRAQGDFDAMYNLLGGLAFEGAESRSLELLDRRLNEAAGYINAVIITASLSSALYERIVNACRNGHFISVLYIAPETRDAESETYADMLKAGGAPCFRIDRTRDIYGVYVND